MTIRIIRGSAGAGKTQYALNQISQQLAAEPFAAIWVILASKRQENAFRQRLIELHAYKPVFFNVEFFNFYELYARLLDKANTPQRLLNTSAQHTLLRYLLAQVKDQLELFGPIAHLPGLVQIVADFIVELKQNRIFPDDFSAAARSGRDRDLALIYRTYQAYLNQHSLADLEGQGWLAGERVTEMPGVAQDLALLVIDGFDQFNVVQADLVAQLAQRARHTCITMPYVTELEMTVGRRFAGAYELLRSQLGEHQIVELDAMQSLPNLNADMRHVRDHIFRSPPRKTKSTGGIRFIEAPDEAEEAAAVLRIVKRLLLSGTAPDEIIIILRSWEAYQPYFVSLRDGYGLPLVLHYGEPLSQNPAIIALLDLLQLHRANFRRRDVLSALRSPYFDVPWIDPKDIDLLERISLEHSVTGSLDLWIEAIALAATMSHRSSPDDDSDQRLIITADFRDRLQIALTDFLGAVTPVDQSTAREFVYWLNGLIGVDPVADLHNGEPGSDGSITLKMLNCIRAEGVSSEIVDRDLLAVQELKRILHGMVAAHELMASLNHDVTPVISWETFFTELQTIINRTSVDPRPARFGRVLVTSATDARGLPHQHVFILGLSEGGFPTATPEDPLYLDHERAALQATNIHLPTRLERASDDALFYELVSLPSQTLTLSRPTQQSGTPWAASPFWRAVEALFSDADTLIAQERIPLGSTTRVGQAASRDELALAVTALVQNVPDSQAQMALAWLRQHHASFWERIRHGQRVEQQRTDGGNQYSGTITDTRLLALIQQELGPQRLWSASQFNDYGACGFRFFTKRLLRLEATREPEEGMDYAQRGSLIHEILERTYKAFIDSRLEISPDNLDVALDVLAQSAAQVFHDAPGKLGFREGPLWDYEQRVLLTMLDRFIRQDFSEPGANPLSKKVKYRTRRPLWLEIEVGRHGKEVFLDLDGVGRVRLHGFVDRVDLLDDSEALVIDYKSGAAPSLKELADGRNYQMLVYLEGIRQLLEIDEPDLRVRGGVFWRMKAGEITGDLMPAMKEEHQEAMDQAITHLAQQVSSGRAGDFPVHPTRVENGRCVRYCEYSQLCRFNARSRLDRR